MENYVKLLVMERLNNDLLLRNDFLTKHLSKIDFEKGNVENQKNGHTYLHLWLFGRSSTFLVKSITLIFLWRKRIMRKVFLSMEETLNTTQWRNVSYTRLLWMSRRWRSRIMFQQPYEEMQMASVKKKNTGTVGRRLKYIFWSICWNTWEIGQEWKYEENHFGASSRFPANLKYSLGRYERQYVRRL